MNACMLNHATPLVTCTDTFATLITYLTMQVIFCTHVQLTKAFMSEISCTQVAIMILLCTTNDVILSMLIVCAWIHQHKFAQIMYSSTNENTGHFGHKDIWLRRWPSWPESMAMFLLLYNICIYVCTYMAYNSLDSSSWSMSSYILMSIDTTPTAS